MSVANGQPAIIFRSMNLADVPQVVAIDQLSFPIPWSAAAYQYEVADNKAGHFIVAIDETAPETQPGLAARLAGRRPAQRVAGYAGFWLVLDEAHIGTLAVHPAYRRRGLGEQLLVALLHRALRLGAAMATLEVRVGNQAAQGLYRKYRFEEVGRRKQYYRDNKEDALLMTAILDAAYGRWISAKLNAMALEITL